MAEAESDGGADLLGRVRSWVRGHGYELEYEAARTLRDAGFWPRQGHMYRDVSSGKTREIDVLAFPAFPSAWRTPVEIAVVMECKKSSHPWVTKRAQLEHDQRVWMPLASPPPVRQFLLDHRTLEAYMPVPDPTAITVVQAFGDRDDQDGSDTAYRAVAQAVAAARGYLHGLDRPALAYPVVVLDAPLFTLSYDEMGGEQLQQWGWDRVLWSGRDSAEPTAVDIVTRSDLSGRAAVLHRELDAVFRALPSEKALAELGQHS